MSKIYTWNSNGGFGVIDDSYDDAFEPGAKRARLTYDGGYGTNAPYNTPYSYAARDMTMRAAIQGVTAGAFPAPGGAGATPSSSGSVMGAFESELRHAMTSVANKLPGQADYTMPTANSQYGGMAMSQERVNVNLIIRPIRMGDEENQFAVPHFRPNDLVFIWIQDVEAIQRTNKQFPRICTVATYEQVRAFEAMPTAAAHAMYKDIGMRMDDETGEYYVIDKDGDRAPLGTTRKGAFSRWMPFGVCAARFTSSGGFNMISVSVKGPTLMRNYWGPHIRVGTDVFLTPIKVEPLLEPGASQYKKLALTVHSVAAWPTSDVLTRINNQLQEERVRFAELARNSNPSALNKPKYLTRNVGPYRIPYTADGSAIVIDGGIADLAGIVILGRILDVYPADDCNNPYMDRTGFYPDNEDRIDGIDAHSTQVYLGDVRINLSTYCGMSAMNAYRSMWARSPRRRIEMTDV